MATRINNRKQQLALSPPGGDINEKIGYAQKETPNLVLDRFSLALAGLASNSEYNAVDGMPYILNDSQLDSIRQGGIFSAVRGALVGGDGVLAASNTVRATNIGNTIIVLAQCLRETNLGVEYLSYSTLPITNVSGLFAASDFVGDIVSLYDRAVSSYPSVYDMFTFEDRQQFLEHPLIPYKLATYVHSYMKYYYGD